MKTLKGLGILSIVAILMTLGVLMDAGNASGEGNPVVVMETSKGTMKIELYPDKAPKTVENFLWYVDNSFYEGLIFHRVIPNFMIQGGGFTPDMVKKKGNPAIPIESKNGLSNVRGSLAMARTSDPNSATSQFFINHKDNSRGLDYGKAQDTWGYTVFGQVIEGDEIIDVIATVKTVNKGGYNDVPATPVIIEKCYRAKETATKAEKKEQG